MERGVGGLVTKNAVVPSTLLSCKAPHTLHPPKCAPAAQSRVVSMD